MSKKELPTFEEYIKALSPHKLWWLERELEAQTKDYTRLAIIHATRGNRGLLELSCKNMVQKAIEYSQAKTQPCWNMIESGGWKEYRKSLPYELYELGEDGKIYEEIIDPFAT